VTSTTRPIRAKVSDTDWQKVKLAAVKQGIPEAQWVGDAIRQALQKGAGR
jgi:hypothetical protein